MNVKQVVKAIRQRPEYMYAELAGEKTGLWFGPLGKRIAVTKYGYTFARGAGGENDILETLWVAMLHAREITFEEFVAWYTYSDVMQTLIPIYRELVEKQSAGAQSEGAQSEGAASNTPGKLPGATKNGEVALHTAGGPIVNPAETAA